MEERLAAHKEKMKRQEEETGEGAPDWMKVHDQKVKKGDHLRGYVEQEFVPY